jgi:hypothetical protein
VSESMRVCVSEQLHTTNTSLACAQQLPASNTLSHLLLLPQLLSARLPACRNTLHPVPHSTTHSLHHHMLCALTLICMN